MYVVSYDYLCVCDESIIKDMNKIINYMIVGLEM